MAFKIVRDDITHVNADMIVNTANPEIKVGTGVDTAIYNAAGKERLLEAREKIGYLEPGQVGITPAFNLSAKYIAHSSGPKWIDGAHDEPRLLRQCYDRCLQMAVDYKCSSIAFPLMATGSYRFPKDLGIRIAVDAFNAFLQNHDLEIILVVFGGSVVQRITGELFYEVQQFIDDNYVEKCQDIEYGFSYPSNSGRGDSLNSLSEEPGNYILEQERDQRVAGTGVVNTVASKMAKSSEPKPSLSLENLLKGMYTDSFEKHLVQLINKKGLKNSEVYAAAGMSKQYFSKLLKGQVKPSKEKVLCLCVGLHLNMDETIDFLKIAGYALSPVSQTDVIVEYFIRKEEYQVMIIDMVLFDYGLPTLSSCQM